MKNLLLFFAVTLAVVFSAPSQAAMSVNSVKAMLVSQGLSDEQASGVIETMKKQVGGDSESLNVSGALYTSGWNGALFVDNDEWDFDVEFEEANTHKPILIEAGMKGYLWNGGFTAGIGYQWVLMFITGSDMDLRTLDGAEFGRGFAIQADVGFGVELGFMPGENRAQDIFLVVPALGVGGGLRFPKVKFTSNLPQ